MSDDTRKTQPELKKEESIPKEYKKQLFQITDITDHLPDGYGVIMSVDDVESKDD